MEFAEFAWPMSRLFYCNIKLGRDQEALRHLKEIVSQDPSFIAPEVLDSLLMESGMEGVVQWYIHWIQVNESQDFYVTVNLNLGIAGLYGVLGDTQAVLDYLEKAFEADETGLPQIMFNADFESLRDDPRIIAMLREMDL